MFAFLQVSCGMGLRYPNCHKKSVEKVNLRISGLELEDNNCQLIYNNIIKTRKNKTFKRSETDKEN